MDAAREIIGALKGNVYVDEKNQCYKFISCGLRDEKIEGGVKISMPYFYFENTETQKIRGFHLLKSPNL